MADGIPIPEFVRKVSKDLVERTPGAVRALYSLVGDGTNRWKVLLAGPKKNSTPVAEYIVDPDLEIYHRSREV